MYTNNRIFLSQLLVDLSNVNFIMLRIYGEALDSVRVRLNMYLVV